MAEQSKGMPISFQPRRIHDVAQYFQSRLSHIEKGLKGVPIETPSSDQSGDFLEQLNVTEQGFAIMCIDMVESTRLADALESSRYSMLVTTLLNELSELVYGFRGHVLKYTGDGIIAYFPEPSLMTMNDLALDCANVIMLFVKKLFNPLSQKSGYPSVGIRIGIDTGRAVVTSIGSSSTKRQKDIIGKTISIAAKIQAIGSPGDILIGEATNRLLHTMWRQGLEEFPVPKDWPYKSKQGEPYRVFKIRSGFLPRLSPTMRDNWGRQVST
jgi:class 3 adenylate cyclase